jgi:hypothetical protein
MADGIVAARQHRREQHRDLPGKTPNPNRRRPDPAPTDTAAHEKKPTGTYELRQRLVAALKQAGKPLTANELAALTGDVSANAVANSLTWARKDGTPLHRVGDAWAWGDGDDVPDPVRARIHAGIVETLASAGSEGMPAGDVAKRVGLGTVSCANHLKSLLAAGKVMKVEDRRGARRWAAL